MPPSVHQEWRYTTPHPRGGAIKKTNTSGRLGRAVPYFTRADFAAIGFQKFCPIGQGGYGLVYRVNGTKGTAVLKVFKESHPDTEDGISRDCLRELAMLRTCAHPQVVALQRVVQLGNHVAAVLESLHTSLFHHYNRRTMKQVNRLILAADMASGLAQLVRMGVMHRDLKPQNILVSENGRAKLADFGQSRLWAPDRSFTLWVCTLWYRAPEMLLGHAAYGVAVDCWSLGCVLAEVARRDPLLSVTPHPNDAPRENQDMLRQIVELVGAPCAADWPDSVVQGEAFRSTATMPHRAMDLDLVKACPNLHPAETELIEGLLCMNPAVRLSAERAEAIVMQALQERSVTPPPKATPTLQTLTTSPPSKAATVTRGTKRKNSIADHATMIVANFTSSSSTAAIAQRIVTSVTNRNRGGSQLLAEAAATIAVMVDRVGGPGVPEVAKHIRISEKELKQAVIRVALLSKFEIS